MTKQPVIIGLVFLLSLSRLTRQSPAIDLRVKPEDDIKQSVIVGFVYFVIVALDTTISFEK